MFITMVFKVNTFEGDHGIFSGEAEITGDLTGIKSCCIDDLPALKDVFPAASDPVSV
jgi:hypothetical protein